MKTISIKLDKELLEELNATEEVQRVGRSAVLRRAVTEYLQRSKSRAVAEGYRRAYGSDPGPGKGFEGWEKQGEWPAG